MIAVTLYVVLDGLNYTRDVVLPGVPRKGELVQLDPDGGWEENVAGVEWTPGNPSTVLVNLGSHIDQHGEDLAEALVAAGWST